MNITFLCGSLEPGRDGVGDYTRRLALEMANYGHQVTIVSLNDRFIKHIYKGKQHNGDKSAEVMRIPAAISKAERFKQAKEWVTAQNPDWVSLQYVPFAFHSRGIPFGLGNHLKSVAPNAKWHIMFHEIWLGESSESTFKDKIIGSLQKSIGKALTRVVNVKAITTTNNYYQKCLKKAGIAAPKIPVFNNLPIGNKGGRAIYNKLLAETKGITDDCVIGALFGRVNVFDGFYANLVKLNSLCIAIDKKLILTHVGRSAHIGNIAKEIKTKTGFTLNILGEADEQDIADYLLSAHFGISTYPKILFEKSGTIAAMFNNGLPVVVLKESFEEDNIKVETIKQVSEITNFNLFLNQEKNFTEAYSLKSVVESYLTLLNKAN